MKKLSPPMLRCAVACLAFLVAGQAAAVGQPERRLQGFKEQTVMITVTRSDQSVEHGAGIVMCQKDRRAFVLTTSDLLAATLPGGRKVLRYPARTEIRFFDDGLASFVDDRAAPHQSGEQGMIFHQVPEDDLVLLSFPFLPPLNTAARRQGFIEMATSRRGKEPPVIAVGHRFSAMETWVHQQGILLPGGGRFLYHSAPIDEGFLGGPLFNKRWLIGINLRRVPGEEIGAEAGVLYGEALSVKQIYPAINRWLPAGCRFFAEWRVDGFLEPTESVPRRAKTTAMKVRERSTSEEGLRSEQTLVPEELKRYTVMITVTFDDQSVEHGAGAVLCEDNDKSYVLTAHHVLAGKQPGGAKKLGRHAERTEIRFFHDSVARVVDESAAGAGVITAHLVPEQDLALLSVPFVQDLGRPDLEKFLTFLSRLGVQYEGPTGPEVRTSDWARAALPHGPAVVAMGYRKSPMETWATERGTLLADDGKLLQHSAEIVGGFSGGPLYHLSGALIGINLERIADENIGVALPIEEILPLIRQWLPENCLRTVANGMERSWGAGEATAVADGRERSWGAMEAATFFAAAEQMEKIGSDWEFRFGPYRVTGIRGGGIREGFSRTRATRKYRFSFVEPTGTMWQGKCSEKIKTEEEGPKFLNFVLDEVLDTSLVVGHNTSLNCVFTEQSGGQTMELVLDERALPEGREGTGTVGAVQIEALGTEASPVYLCHVGNRILGAVLRDERPTVWEQVTDTEGYSVWLDPAVTAEMRSTCAAAAAALLLHCRESAEGITGSPPRG